MREGATENGSKAPIYVTSPFLPPLEEFLPYLEEIWKSRSLTNNGRMHQEFEAELARYLGVKHLSLINNGTIALLVALKALRITGEVITTPYTFVATAHSLLWNDIDPVFVDIDPHTLNLDPSKIESAITPRTTAIMPVHCYGQPCDTQSIQRIADRYNLKVIYDAAHAFGVEDDDGTILRHGDMSVVSFHATKVFTTFEGGVIICRDENDKKRIDYLKNFGFADEVTVVSHGINGKMSEFNAALGLVQLKYFSSAMEKREAIAKRYRQGLKGIPGLEVVSRDVARVDNCAYFAILIKPGFGCRRDDLYAALKEKNIYARRYFYPLVSSFPMYRGLRSAREDNVLEASRISSQILCLPIYAELNDSDVDRVVDVIREASSGISDARSN